MRGDGSVDKNGCWPEWSRPGFEFLYLIRSITARGARHSAVFQVQQSYCLLACLLPYLRSVLVLQAFSADRNMSTSFEGPPAGGESRRRYYEQGGSKWDIKSFLRIASTGFALPATILFAVAVAYTNQDFVNLSGNGDWSDGLALAPVCPFRYSSSYPLDFDPPSKTRAN